MLSSGQIRAARAFLGLGQRQLAEKAGVSFTTVQRIEDVAIGPGRSSAQNLEAVQRALEALGIEFLGEDGVRLRKTEP
jgi:transcriptional regulator with XRE-family HTH domain